MVIVVDYDWGDTVIVDGLIYGCSYINSALIVVVADGVVVEVVVAITRGLVALTLPLEALTPLTPTTTVYTVAIYPLSLLLSLLISETPPLTN